MTAVAPLINMPQPFFLNGGAGNVFALYFPAMGERKGSILYVPPFAEEMNRCRVAAAEQARRLSQQGYAVLLLDLYGTGDSQGDLVDASWDIWCKDVEAAAAWLAENNNVPVILWGFRLGALLAAEVANSNPQRFERMMLWQPVLSGKMFLTQYLRLRVAYLMDRGLPAETTADMRQKLQSGDALEVAGYVLSGRLTEDFDSKQFANFSALQGLQVDWFEYVAEHGKPFTINSQKVIKQLEAQDCAVSTHAFTGAQIWQLHKRDEVPELIELTCKRFQE